MMAESGRESRQVPGIKQLQVVRAGERTNSAGKPVGNKILLSIPDVEYRRIRPHLEFVDLQHHFTLHEPREKLQFVYFLNRGLASIVVEYTQRKGRRGWGSRI